MRSGSEASMRAVTQMHMQELIDETSHIGT